MRDNTNISIWDSIVAASYLIWIIAKQHWKLLLVLMVTSFVLIPLPKIFYSMNYDFKNSAGLIGSFTILPSLLTLLVFLPIVNAQIKSSSIQKRMKASGVSFRNYTFVMIISFALLALAIFYGMLIISVIIFDGNQYWIDTMYVEIWNKEIVWWSLLLITPISFIGLSSLGILLSRWNAPDIGKGFATFLIILILLALSRTIFSPLDALSESRLDPNSDNYSLARINKLKTLDTLLFVLNPFGAMVFSAEYGMLGGILATIPSTQYPLASGDFLIPNEHFVNYLESYERYISIAPTIIYSCLWTVGLTSATVYWS